MQGRNLAPRRCDLERVEWLTPLPNNMLGKAFIWGGVCASIQNDRTVKSVNTSMDYLKQIDCGNIEICSINLIRRPAANCSPQT